MKNGSKTWTMNKFPLYVVDAMNMATCFDNVVWIILKKRLIRHLIKHILVFPKWLRINEAIENKNIKIVSRKWIVLIILRFWVTMLGILWIQEVLRVILLAHRLANLLQVFSLPQFSPRIFLRERHNKKLDRSLK